MSGFIEWLEGRNAKDKKVRAVLRRSLSFVPGECIPAIPYIEPFIGDGDNSRWRETLYLIAGLWAAHWREGREGEPLSIGKACAAFDNDRRSKMNSETQALSDILKSKKIEAEQEAMQKKRGKK